MPTISPGWTTTEFYATLVADLFALLEVFKIVVPNQGPLITAISVLGAAIATAVYTHGRSRIKAAQQSTPPVNVQMTTNTPATNAGGATVPLRVVPGVTAPVAANAANTPAT